LLLRIEECRGDLKQVTRTVKFRSGWWTGVQETVAHGSLSFGGGLHFAVLEHSCEQGSLFGPSPVERSFRDQQMKQGVICGRNCSPEARLPRFPALAIRKVIRLLKQVVCKCHSSGPGGILKIVLFRFAPEIEVGVESHFVRLHFLFNTPPDAPDDFSELRRFACGVRQKHAKEKGGFSRPVVRKAVTDANDIRTQRLLSAQKRVVDLRFVNKSSGYYRHRFIIPGFIPARQPSGQSPTRSIRWLRRASAGNRNPSGRLLPARPCAC
jgi:hypothetical protein